MTPYHPWRDLSTLWPHVHVHYVDDLPDERLGETDGYSLIRLKRRQLQVDRRCTLAHELVHMERGEGESCPPAVDDRVTRIAARRLISWDALLDAARWAMSAEEMADELWVTETMLRARVADLSALELLELGRAAQA